MVTIFHGLYYVDGLVHERRNSIANALELRHFFALTHRYVSVTELSFLMCGGRGLPMSNQRDFHQGENSMSAKRVLEAHVYPLHVNHRYSSGQHPKHHPAGGMTWPARWLNRWVARIKWSSVESVCTGNTPLDLCHNVPDPGRSRSDAGSIGTIPNSSWYITTCWQGPYLGAFQKHLWALKSKRS